MAVLLPRYSIPGYEGMDPEAAAELLHQRKNRPETPDLDMLLHQGAVVPYEKLTADQKAFPCALYRAWTDEGREMARLRAARQLQLNVKDPLDLDAIDRHIGAYDSIVARDAQDKLIKKGQGWCDSQADAKAAAFADHRALATDAAISHEDDKKILSPKAMAERERIDDAADDHIAEIPHTPVKRRGRPVRVTK